MLALLDAVELDPGWVQISEAANAMLHCNAWGGTAVGRRPMGNAGCGAGAGAGGGGWWLLLPLVALHGVMT
jgi:hypothetical protein